MTTKIEVHKDYISVESLSGFETQELLDTIEELKNGFKGRNVIWSFHEGPILLVPEDFKKIFNQVQINTTMDMRGTKIALSVKSWFMHGLAVKFANQCRNQFPLKIKVFSDFHAAKKWISS